MKTISPFVWSDCKTLRTCLRTGHYSIEWDRRDVRDVVAIERKSTSDLLGCIGRGRDRFERALARLAKISYRALVIEGSLGDLLEHPFTAIHPNTVIGSVMAWAFRYGLPPIFCGERSLAAAVTRALLIHRRSRVNAALSAEISRLHHPHTATAGGHFTLDDLGWVASPDRLCGTHRQDEPARAAASPPAQWGR